MKLFKRKLKEKPFEEFMEKFIKLIEEYNVVFGLRTKWIDREIVIIQQETKNDILTTTVFNVGKDITSKTLKEKFLFGKNCEKDTK